MPNTYALPGIEPGPFDTLPDDATHLAIQPPNIYIQHVRMPGDDSYGGGTTWTIDVCITLRRLRTQCVGL